MSKFKRLKEEIESDVQRIEKRIKKLCSKIKANLHCRTNPDGLLRQTKADYIENFEFKQESRLEHLLKLDHAFWSDTMKKEKSTEKTKKSLDQLIEKSQNELNKVLISAEVRPKMYTLKRLPLWGVQDLTTNFEWPSEDIDIE